MEEQTVHFGCFVWLKSRQSIVAVLCGGQSRQSIVVILCSGKSTQSIVVVLCG